MQGLTWSIFSLISTLWLVITSSISAPISLICASIPVLLILCFVDSFPACSNLSHLGLKATVTAQSIIVPWYTEYYLPPNSRSLFCTHRHKWLLSCHLGWACSAPHYDPENIRLERLSPHADHCLRSNTCSCLNN